MSVFLVFFKIADVPLPIFEESIALAIKIGFLAFTFVNISITPDVPTKEMLGAVEVVPFIHVPVAVENNRSSF